MAAAAPFRLVRSSMIAASALSLASAAHTVVGGGLPEPLIFLAIAALTLLTCTFFSRWKLGALSILSLLAVSQLALHQCFEWFTMGSMPNPPQQDHHHNALILPLSSELPSHSVDSAGVGMLAAHIIATLVTALLVARGETALWALGDWLRPLLRVLAPILLPVPRHPTAGPIHIERAKPQRFLKAERWRGPPWLRFSAIL